MIICWTEIQNWKAVPVKKTEKTWQTWHHPQKRPNCPPCKWSDAWAHNQCGLFGSNSSPFTGKTSATPAGVPEIAFWIAPSRQLYLKVRTHETLFHQHQGDLFKVSYSTMHLQTQLSSWHISPATTVDSKVPQVCNAWLIPNPNIEAWVILITTHLRLPAVALQQ